ncbi:glycine cleavage system aminomethyltransferase GcvT [Alkalinema sp. FACHB-956]|uniref:glycine cleavage system aminomethyltransferase GcvT n=1 Tax=Alkalinema sp. FACHB-956 TaxID=2692768 RepID=UPI00321F9226
MTDTLQRTPLFDLMGNARTIGFSGWEMPVQFSSITQEHQAVRTAVGMFDISHMGAFSLKGNVLEQIQRLVPSDLSRLQPGQAQYTVLLNSQGGIIDDLIFYYQGGTGNEQSWITIVNAATMQKDWNWMQTNLDLNQLQLENRSQNKTLIAVQGPQAVGQLQALVQGSIESLKAFEHTEASFNEQPIFVARTGYTGEDGFEVMSAPEVGRALWQALLAAGVTPCGLGARDTLRLEAAMCLYGQDINDETTPLEAGLGWLVHLDRKGEFIGRSVLEQQKAEGVKKRLMALQLEGRNIARHDYPILNAGETVGIVTSGTLSPTLGYPVALGYVPTELATIGNTVEVSIRGKAYPATIVKKPFYKASR